MVWASGGIHWKSRFNCDLAILRPCDVFGQFDCRAEIRVLAYDDSDVVSSLMSSLNQVDRDAHVHAFFLPALVHFSPVRVDPSAPQVSELIRPETMPMLVSGTLMDAGVETNFGECAPPLPGCQ